MGYSGAWVKLIHEKNTWSQKSRGTVPLNYILFYCTKHTKKNIVKKNGCSAVNSIFQL